MKFAIAILSLCIVGSMGAMPTVLDLIRHEVHALLAADKDLTVDHCSTKCDALFDLAESHDEANTDKLCHYTCNCMINPHSTACHGFGHNNNHHSTHAPHHSTHAPHHTKAN